MKIAFVFLIVGIFMFPLQEASANYDSMSSLNKENGRSLQARNMTFAQDYKVKNRQQATQMLKKRYKAKVVNVQSAKVNGNPGYKAKLLANDGIVFYVYIDAVTGQMKRR
jgi:uncharacterized membrane protein YkoI